jgi:hypothetical protein
LDDSEDDLVGGPIALAIDLADAAPVQDPV